MSKLLGNITFLLFAILLFAPGCRKKGCTDPMSISYNADAKRDDGSCSYPTPYNLQIPQTFQLYLPPPEISSENQLTNEGVELGKKLYYDPILDGIGSRSCSQCHLQENSFSSSPVNSLPHLNLAWNTNFLWNGKVSGTVEDIMYFEVQTFFNTDLDKLNSHDEYPALFNKTFGVSEITHKEVVFALSQFFRTLISGNSKFDKFILNQTTLTPQELSGYDVFMDESGGDCFHCHGDPTNPLWTDNKFHNNGLDATITDKGLGEITGNSWDDGKFKTPTLRNLIFTAPYMHDGRFETLEEVIMHYSTGLRFSPTIDPLMKNVSQGGNQLTPQEMQDLKAFLLTLTDSSFIYNQELNVSN